MVLMHTTACALFTGQSSAKRSSTSGSPRLGNPASARQAGKPGGVLAGSGGCHSMCGRSRAKCTACWPLPLPISSTRPGAVKISRSTARIGSLLRSQEGECCFMVRTMVDYYVQQNNPGGCHALSSHPDHRCGG